MDLADVALTYALIALGLWITMGILLAIFFYEDLTEGATVVVSAILAFLWPIFLLLSVLWAPVVFWVIARARRQNKEETEQ